MLQNQTCRSRKRLQTTFLAALALALTTAITPGTPAPDISAPNQDGKTIRLADLKGKPVILYFYPKDDTPGCTQEACRFRDEYSKFQKLGAVILGVSSQDSESHQAFKSKHKLPFDLLIDRDGSVAKAFGVDRIPLIGLHKRQTVLIGPDGKVVRHYTDVDPKTHADELLKDLASLGAK